MGIFNNALEKDLRFVLENKEVSTDEIREYTLEIHAKEHVYETDAILSCDVVEDYTKSATIKKYVKAILPKGDFLRYLVNDRDLLEATLITRHVDGREQVENFRLILNPELNNEMDVERISSIDKDRVNAEDHSIFTLELIPVSAEALMNIKVGGIVKDCGMGDILQSVLSHEIKPVKISGQSVISNTVIDTPNNQASYRQVIIPDGTHLLALPHYLQTHYGVYNAGIGVFIKQVYTKDSWRNNLHVYQLFNPDRFDRSTKKLALISSHMSMIDLVDKTTLIKDDTLYGVGELIVDKTNTAETTTNVGRLSFQSINEEAFETGATKDSELGPSINPSEHVNAVRFANRLASDNITTNEDAKNVFLAMSEVAAMTGEIKTFKWVGAPHTRFTPGMSVALLYLKDEMVVSLEGVLLKHHVFTTKINEGFTQKKYSSTSMLTLFLKSRIY